MVLDLDQMAAKSKFDGENEDESLKEFLIRSMDETFIDNIPMEAIKDLPKFYMYLFGAFGEIFGLLVFTYFMYSVYEQGVQQQFISITPSSGNCNEIPKSVSGSYIADENGSWAGSSNFDPSEGIYVIGFTDAHLTFPEYEQSMQLAQTQMQLLSAGSVSQNLATNLLLYMSWQFVCDPTVHSFCKGFVGQSFAFTASSQYSLAVTYLDVTISNEKADCLALSVSSYDLANAVNTGSYDYATFMGNPTCNTSVVPQHMGYDSTLSGPSFSIGMDVRTMIDSVAVNSGMLDATGLNAVGNTEVYEFEHNGYNYTAGYYIDTWYAGLHPLFCAVNNDAVVDTTLGVTEICMWLQGNLTGVPIFLHYGAGFEPYNSVSPMPCDW